MPVLVFCFHSKKNRPVTRSGRSVKNNIEYRQAQEKFLSASRADWATSCLSEMRHCEWYMAQGPFSRAEQTMVIASEAKQSVCSAPGGCSWEAFFAEAISVNARLVRVRGDRFAEKRSR
jgi:hypothetical protein